MESSKHADWFQTYTVYFSTGDGAIRYATFRRLTKPAEACLAIRRRHPGARIRGLVA
jgi:hypothetical protein